MLRQLGTREPALTVYSQDDPGFPEDAAVIDDTALAHSYRLGIQIVPTLIRVTDGLETARTVGWDRGEWETVSGFTGLGPGLPSSRPGCGSKSEEPGTAERLAVRFGKVSFQSRQVRVSASTDPIEACYERGWTDGLPVVPPTPERVLAMLKGTTRSPQDIVGRIPPDYVECSVEKIAINAVLAGCKPEYLPVVPPRSRAALVPVWSPRRAGNHELHWPGRHGQRTDRPRHRHERPRQCVGAGEPRQWRHRAALQLVVRNVGGGRPGEIDRATLGNPGKYTFCFAEDEEGSLWDSFAVERGYAHDVSTVTVFVGDGAAPIVDEISRTPESLARSFAACLRAAHHPKKVIDVAAFLVVTPEHARVFHDAEWSKLRLKAELEKLLQIPVAQLLRGADGIEAGILPTSPDPHGTLPKFRTGSLTYRARGRQCGEVFCLFPGWIHHDQSGHQEITPYATRFCLVPPGAVTGCNVRGLGGRPLSRD